MFHCRAHGITLTLLFTLLMTACANPIQYSDDYQSGVNFDAYQSFAWHELNEFNDKTNRYIANDMVDKRIRSAVVSELVAKGFNQSAEDDADFWVNYSIMTEDKIDIRTYNTYNGMAPGWRYMRSGPYGYGYYGIGYSTIPTEVRTDVINYTVGTLVVDIVHAASGELVWRGTAKGRLKQNELSATERDQLISEIVNNILSGFPPN